MKKVITYGTFDLLHQGHINLLRRAKALGDWLIVGVTTDNFDLERGKLNTTDNVMKRIDAVRATGLADQVIIEEYRGQKIDDIHKYADTTDIPKIEACYRAIPRLLAKENRKFKYAEVEKGGSERKYASSVDWLCDASFATRAQNVSTAAVPLNANVRDGWFKLYLSDINDIGTITFIDIFFFDFIKFIKDIADDFF